MDPMVGTVIGIVSPFLIKGTEEFAKSAGSAAFEQAKKLVDRLSQWWSGEPVAEALATAFPSNPKHYSEALGNELARALEKDPAFANELRGLVNQMGTFAKIVQDMEIAHGVTGADIGTLVSGSISARQKVREAHNVTGLKAGKVGGS